MGPPPGGGIETVWWMGQKASAVRGWDLGMRCPLTQCGSAPPQKIFSNFDLKILSGISCD